jgi:hypothetical protein
MIHLSVILGVLPEAHRPQEDVYTGKIGTVTLFIKTSGEVELLAGTEDKARAFLREQFGADAQ